MYVELLARSERCIEQQHDHEMTVSALWERVKSLAAKEQFNIPDTIIDFECLLDGDKRFRLSEMKPGEAEEHAADPDEEELFLENDEIEGLGFDHEQKVTLARFYSDDDGDEADDEAFAPRPFEKNDEHVDVSALQPVKKASLTREKKPAVKKKPTKRK